MEAQQEGQEVDVAHVLSNLLRVIERSLASVKCMLIFFTILTTSANVGNKLYKEMLHIIQANSNKSGMSSKGERLLTNLYQRFLSDAQVINAILISNKLRNSDWLFLMKSGFEMNTKQLSPSPMEVLHI